MRQKNNLAVKKFNTPMSEAQTELNKDRHEVNTSKWRDFSNKPKTSAIKLNTQLDQQLGQYFLGFLIAASLTTEVSQILLLICGSFNDGLSGRENDYATAFKPSA